MPSVRPALDVVHYDFALTLPDAGASFRGDAALTVWRQSAADTMALDLIGLGPDSVLVNGTRVIATRAGNRILVPLPPGAGCSEVGVMTRTTTHRPSCGMTVTTPAPVGWPSWRLRAPAAVPAVPGCASRR